MGITLAVMPHCTTLTEVLILAGINGFSIGTFDTAINVWILELWGENSGPFMQALHFTYGIGSFVAPLICEPFLSTESIHSGGHGIMVPQLDDTVDVVTTIGSTDTNNDSLHQHLSTQSTIDPIDYLIYIPYAIAGTITVFSSTIILFLYYFKKYEPPAKPAKSIDINGDPLSPIRSNDGKNKIRKKYRLNHINNN